jgi:hypothetical protein
MPSFLACLPDAQADKGKDDPRLIAARVKDKFFKNSLLDLLHSFINGRIVVKELFVE